MAEDGYGYAHRQARKRFARLVATGTVVCARAGCGRLIDPDEDWDLGHDDSDRTRYVGPEHAACNRATAGRRGGLLDRRRHSRRW